MGDGVNVASRLEGMNKVFGTTICVSDRLVDAIGRDIICRPLRTIRVKGREGTFMFYELLGIRGSDDPELLGRKEAHLLSEMTWEASGCFEGGEYGDAARCYRKILEMFPGDPAAISMLGACGRTDWQKMASRLTGASEG